MIHLDSIALNIIETWKRCTYFNECQANAALQVLLIEALKEQYEEVTRYKDAYENMKKFAIDSGLDVTCYGD